MNQQPGGREPMQQVTSKPVSIDNKKNGAFISDVKSSFKSASKYVWKNVVIPYTKRIVIDSTNNAVSILLGDKPGSVQGNRNKVILNNGTVYKDYTRPAQQSKSMLFNNDNLPNRKLSRYESFVFETYTDAQAVLQELANYIETYGAASVAVYCELCGDNNKSFNDDTYGWDNISTAIIQAVPDGYKIKFPCPIKII